MIPTTHFAHWKGLGTCDSLLCVSRALQSKVLCGGHDAEIVQIDFRAVIGRVSYLGILYNLCSVGI